MAREGLTIEARGLVKVYGKTRALDGIDLTVRRGQVFGFLGPNGAGKTTTIRILATLTRPDGGYSGGMRRRLDIGASLIVTRPSSSASPTSC